MVRARTSKVLASRPVRDSSDVRASTLPPVGRLPGIVVNTTAPGEVMLTTVASRD
jgi:hypothetical protein